MNLAVLDPLCPDQPFPDPELASKEPEGLLAIGGCLSPRRILNAYSLGIFPWYSPDEPILWWSPNPRLVLFPEQLKVSRSLAKKIRKQVFRVTVNQAFDDVIKACAAPRHGQKGTWITEEMQLAYQRLHRLGVAHSAEAYYNERLVGGLYGISIGRVFFGESMFHTHTDASKVAFATLVNALQNWGYQLIDCQVYSDHLVSLGAVEVPRKEFLTQINSLCMLTPQRRAWKTL